MCSVLIDSGREMRIKSALNFLSLIPWMTLIIARAQTRNLFVLKYAKISCFFAVNAMRLRFLGVYLLTKNATVLDRLKMWSDDATGLKSWRILCSDSVK